MAKEREQLQKSLSPASIWAVAVGSIIGWGCFIQGANWTIRAGGPLPLVCGFLVGGLLMIVVGASYSYMIAKFPVAGGEFAYAYKGFGRTAAFICGWMLSLGYVSIVALNATALPLLMSLLLPGALEHGFLYTVAGYDVYLGEALFSCFFIVGFGIMNYRGVKSVGNLQLIMVVIMCAAVAVSFFGTLTTSTVSFDNLQPLYGVDKSFTAGFISILALAPFLYVGFDCIPQAAEEYDFPPHKAKFLISSALIVGAMIYAAMAIATDIVIPWQDVIALTDETGAPVKWYTGAVLEMTVMGRLGVAFVAIAVSMGICTGLNGFFMTSSRLLFGMARAKMLPAVFGQVHPTYQTPAFCVLFTMVICCFCPFFGREVINWVVDMCSIGTAVGYFFTCACAFYLTKNFGTPEDENKIPPWLSLCGCVISVSIMLLLLVPFSPAFMVPESFGALIIWVILGAVFYAASVNSFNQVSKRDMDFYILNGVQVVHGTRKDHSKQEYLQGKLNK